MMSTKSKSEQYTEKMKLRQRKKNRNTIEVDDDEDGAVWVGYRKLADKYDQDMISGFKHTIDGLLILAGLFSTIVATFLTQTYQSLKPNPAALSLILQFEQIEIMRAGAGNSSSVPSSAVTKDTTTFTQIDLWVNGLLFTSLALSVVSAFLGGLVRQWLQSYLSHTTGSAKTSAIARQFRFDGVRKWKLAEIVGTLPLILHLAFIVFFCALSLLVYDLHPSMAIPVIGSTTLAALLYLATAILPTLWLDCPYRVPFLFRLFRPVVLLTIDALCYTRTIIIPVITRTITDRRAAPTLPAYTPPTTVLTPMRNAEYKHLSDTNAQMVTVARSLNWLIPSSRENERLVSEAIKSTILSKGLDEFGHPQLWFYDFLKIAPLHTAIRWGLFITTRKPNERDDPTYKAADWCQFFDMLRTHNSLPAKYLNVYLGELVETGSRDIAIAEQLVSWGANIEDSGVLAKAVDAGDLNFLSFVLNCANKFRDPNQVETAFSQAASRGNLDIVRIFVQKGVPISNYVAETAYCSGQYDVALFLLQHGAEVPNLRRILPLLPEHLQDQFQHLFLNFGALPNPSGESLLVLVAQEGDFETVKALIEEGVDINSVVPITQKSGRQEYFTPLSAAAEQSHLEILSFLLAKGAHVNPAPAMATPGPYGGISRSIEAVAPLLKAALNGHVEAAEMLIANGANVHKVLETLSEREADANDDDQILKARRSKVQELLVQASVKESKERELAVEGSIRDDYE